MRQQEFPKQQVEFMRDMLSGLPVNSISVSPAETSLLGDLAGTLGGLGALATALNDPAMKAFTDPMLEIIRGIFGGSTSTPGESTGETTTGDAGDAGGAQAGDDLLGDGVGPGLED